jgi:hypothetical protein
VESELAEGELGEGELRDKKLQTDGNSTVYRVKVKVDVDSARLRDCFA